MNDILKHNDSKLDDSAKEESVQESIQNVVSGRRVVVVMEPSTMRVFEYFFEHQTTVETVDGTREGSEMKRLLLDWNGNG